MWKKKCCNKQQYMESAQQEPFNIELLKDESIKILYQRRMNWELEVDTGPSAEKIHNYIKEKAKNIAREVVGTKIQKCKMS